jgi:hypothetical protein
MDNEALKIDTSNKNKNNAVSAIILNQNGEIQLNQPDVDKSF